MTEPVTPRSMWEQPFSADTYVFGTEPNEFLGENTSALRAGSVLCLAEGEGRNAVYLAEAGYDVRSVDLSEAGVVKTLRLAEPRRVHVDAVTGDLAQFDIGTNRWTQ